MLENTFFVCMQLHNLKCIVIKTTLNHIQVIRDSQNVGSLNVNYKQCLKISKLKAFFYSTVYKPRN